MAVLFATLLSQCLSLCMAVDIPLKKKKVASIPSHTGSQPKNIFFRKKTHFRRSEETKSAKYYIVFLTVFNWLNIRLRPTDFSG